MPKDEGPFLRKKFVARFSEDDAVRLEEAAIGHMAQDFDSHSEDNWGSDPFRYILMVVLARECVSDPHYRASHGIQADPQEFHLWVLDEAHMAEFDGDCPDFLALMAGVYNQYINWKQAGITPPEGWSETAGDIADFKALSPEEKIEAMMRSAEEIRKMLEDRDK